MSQEAVRTPRELSGIQKVAVVLMQLDQEQAAEVMRQFNEFESEEIAAELLRLRRVDDEVIQRTLGEVHELATASLVGGRDAASGLLEASFGNEKATIVMNRLSSSTAGSSFEFLEGTDAAHLISLLDGELPQTAALVLGYLRPEVASQVLAGLPSQLRTQIAAALATMGTAVPEAVRVVSEELKRRTGSLVARHEPVEQVGGIQPLVDIINRSDIAVEKEILASLGQFDAALAEEVTSRLLSFADLLRFERRDIQRVLRGVNATTLAFALKGAAQELEAVIRENISERTAELLDSEIAVMDRVRVSEVEAARADIVQQIRALEASGEITVRRGDGDDFVSEQNFPSSGLPLPGLRAAGTGHGARAFHRLRRGLRDGDPGRGTGGPGPARRRSAAGSPGPGPAGRGTGQGPGNPARCRAGRRRDGCTARAGSRRCADRGGRGTGRSDHRAGAVR